MVVPLNKETAAAAILVCPINPPGIELYSYANVFLFPFFFLLKNMFIDHVSENTL